MTCAFKEIQYRGWHSAISLMPSEVTVSNTAVGYLGYLSIIEEVSIYRNDYFIMISCFIKER